MNVEQRIAEIERLERIYAIPDARPMNAGDLAAANRKHDDRLASSPWFKLWKSYGICCRSTPDVASFGEVER